MKRMVDEPLIDKLKTLTKEINYNKENNTLEIGGNLEVDGASSLKGLKPFLVVSDNDGDNSIYLYNETKVDESNYWGFCIINDYCGFYLNSVDNRYFLFYCSEDGFFSIDTIDIETSTNTYSFVSQKEYNLNNTNNITHSVVINGQGGIITFNFISSINTPIDSVQDLYSYLTNDKLACNGFYKDSSGNKDFIYYLSFGTDITTATINDSAIKLTDVIGTNLLIKDDVKDIR